MERQVCSATILGVIFVAVGLLGFVPNPIVSDVGYFQVNAAHNFVHLITGALLLLSPYFGVPVLMIRTLAIAYTAIASPRIHRADVASLDAG